MNLQTGVATVNPTDYLIKRMISLPIKRDRTFEYDLAYIAVGKNFTYGGYYDRNRREFILDARDMPKVDGEYIEIDQSSQLIHQGRLIEIESVTPTEGTLAYIIIGRYHNSITPAEQENT